MNYLSATTTEQLALLGLYVREDTGFRVYLECERQIPRGTAFADDLTDAARAAEECEDPEDAEEEFWDAMTGLWLDD